MYSRFGETSGFESLMQVMAVLCSKNPTSLLRHCGQQHCIVNVHVKSITCYTMHDLTCFVTSGTAVSGYIQDAECWHVNEVISSVLTLQVKQNLA